MTGPDGRYRLYGVPAVAEMRVTKAGYEPVVQRLSLSDHQTQNFTLALTTARVNLAGTYTLTISAPAECLDKLPQEVWTRRYTATVTQSGPASRCVAERRDIRRGWQRQRRRVSRTD